MASDEAAGIKDEATKGLITGKECGSGFGCRKLTDAKVICC